MKNTLVKAQPGGQDEFLRRTEYEVGFGGAAGPGKSWALVVDALGLQFIKSPLKCAAIEVPNYRGILFRRETPQLAKLMDEANTYYLKRPFNAKLIYSRRGEPGILYEFPSGAKINLAHMEHANDRYNFDGFEFQYCGFDEVTQFLLVQYLHLFSRTRSVVPNLWPRVRSATNPIGIGLNWYKRRFIKMGEWKATFGKTYYWKTDPDADVEDNPRGIPAKKDDPRALSRCFIPGNLMENKVLMKTDPDYPTRIMAMGKKYEKALLHSDWDAFGGDFFDDFSKEDMAIDPFLVPKTWYIVGAIDPGWSNYCAYGQAARSPSGEVFQLFTYYQKKRSPDQHAHAIKEMITRFPFTHGRMPDIIVSGTDAFAKKEKFSSARTELTFADIFMAEGLMLQPAKTDRILGWWVWKTLMRRRHWKYYRDFNDALIDEITSAVGDEDNPDDILGLGNDPNVVDHAIDMERYLLMAIGLPLVKPEDMLPDWAKKKKKQLTSHSVLGV